TDRPALRNHAGPAARELRPDSRKGRRAVRRLLCSERKQGSEGHGQARLSVPGRGHAQQRDRREGDEIRIRPRERDGRPGAHGVELRERSARADRARRLVLRGLGGRSVAAGEALHGLSAVTPGTRFAGWASLTLDPSYAAVRCVAGAGTGTTAALG